MLPTYELDVRTLVHTIWSPSLLPDARLWLRLETSVEMLFQRWTSPSSTMGRAELRGYQRLCNNRRVSAEALASKSYDATLSAVALCRRVVLAHDTTEIDLSGRYEPDDAGPLRSNSASGYLVHGCTAVDSETGSRMGVLDAWAWTRSWRFTKDKDHDKRPPHKRESMKWRRGVRRAVERLRAGGLTVAVVHAFDREGDVHENFTFALREKHLVVVRASANRRVEGPHETLWEHMSALPAVGTCAIRVPVRASKRAREAAQEKGERAVKRFDAIVKAAGKSRDATLEIRYGSVTFTPPRRRKRSAVTVNCVRVTEVNAPPWCEPLCWTLLTTCPVDTLEQAWQVVEDYRCRWGSEDIHKLVKSGLGIEEGVVDSIESFRRKLAIVLPLAAHVMQWTYAARETPGEPASRYLSAELLTSISLACRHAKLKVTRPPRTLGELVQRLAQLGGYEPNKKRPPGWQVVWRGWQRLMEFCEVFDFAKSVLQPAEN